MGLGSVLNFKENAPEQARKKTQRIITNTLQFSINSLGILNRLVIKKRFKVEKLDQKTMDTFFKSFNGVLSSIGKYYTEIVCSSKFERNSPEDQTVDLPELYSKFFLNTGVFLWTFSANKLTTSV